MSEPVTVGEFERAMESISRQLANLQGTSHETLVEARKTNGRVNGLERLTAEHGIKLKNLEREVFVEAPPAAAGGAASTGPVTATEDKPITRRDLVVAVGAVGALLAVVKWLPALVSIGRVAP